MLQIINSVLLVLILVFWLQVGLHRSNKKSVQLEEEFWERERKANFTRKKDISNLPYIKIPLDSLPFRPSASSTIEELQATIQNLAEQKIINLNHMTNTDIKLTYGTANYPILSEYDQNYIVLVRTLYKWGKTLYEEGFIEDAKLVLEYAITCKTDIKSNYTLLASIYKEQKDTNSIQSLLETAHTLTSIMKESIITELNTYLKE